MRKASQRLLSAVLAGITALSVSVSARAAAAVPEGFAETSRSANVRITGTTVRPTIKMALPGDSIVVSNPYRLNVKIGNFSSDEQVVFPTRYIENLSDSRISVSATVTGTVAGNTRLAAQSIQSMETAPTTNSVFMYFTMAAVDGPDSEPEWASCTGTEMDETGCIVIRTTAKTKNNMVVLTQAKDADTPADSGGYAALHIGGDAVVAPRTAWTARDTVSVALAFTFTAIANE